MFKCGAILVSVVPGVHELGLEFGQLEAVHSVDEISHSLKVLGWIFSCAQEDLVR